MNIKASEINPVQRGIYKVIGMLGTRYSTPSATYIINPFNKSVILFEHDRDSVWSYTKGHKRYDYLIDYVTRGAAGKVRKYTKK
jgi:hypothetical protein